MAGRSATVAVQITGDAKQLMRAFGQAETSMEKMERRLAGFGRAMSTAVTLPLVAAGAAAVKLAGEQEKAEAKLSSAFESMSASAWTSEQALKDHASAIQENSVVGDEAVISMQSVLLTFGNLKDEVGAGNDVFSRTTQVVVDMAQALDMDLNSAAIQLGKALNDPVKNLSALSRAGIQFTDEQKNLITTLWESGDALGAQKVILEELERQFGGTAAAIADTDFGRMQQALNDLGDAAEDIGAILLPVLADLAGKVSDLAKGFQELDPEQQKVFVNMAIAAAAAGPVALLTSKLLAAGSAIVGLGRAIKGASLGYTLIAMAGAATTAATALGGLVVVFSEFESRAFLKRAAEQTDTWTQAILQGIEQMPIYGRTILGALGLAERFAGEAEDAAEGVDQVDTASQRWADTNYTDLIPSLKETLGLTEDNVSAVEELHDAQRAAIDPVFNLVRATEDYNKAVEERERLERDGKRGTEEWEQATWDSLEALLELNGARDSFSSDREFIEAFRAIAAAAGLSADEIDRLLAKILELDGASVSVKTTGKGGWTASSSISRQGNAFHDGGVVPGRPGQEVPAVLMAGETVLPTHKKGAAGPMGNVTLNVYNPTTNDLDSDLRRALTAVRLLGVV